MKKNTFVSLCLTLFLTISLSAQKTVWVASTASGAANGTSETDAYGNFTTALADITGEGDVLRVVGTVSAVGQNLNDKNFQYSIEGDGAGSTLTGSPTGAARMFTINGPSVGQNVTFKNITFKGTPDVSVSLAGGGVLFSNQSGVTINFENCRFEGNSLADTVTAGGGALIIINSSVTINDCLFKENKAFRNGGAISIGNNANVTISKTTFYKNSTTDTTSSFGGGALFVSGSAVVNIDYCTFFQNNIGHANQDYGTIRTEATVNSNNVSTTVTNSLFYDNKVKNLETGLLAGASDWGSSPHGIQTFSKSLGQWITSNIDNRTDFISFVKASTNPAEVAANLASSNLTYDDVLGKVTYSAPTVEGENSPIGFVSAGIDAGAWQSGLTLSLNREDLLASKISIYHNKSLNSLELYHTISEPLSIEIYNILGAKILNLKDVAKSQSIRASSLKNGIYILVGKTKYKFFSKKFLIN